MDEKTDAVIRTIDHLVRSTAAAMLDDRMYADLEGFCSDARDAAERGDLEKAHRLLHYAQTFIEEENSASGTE